MMKKTLFSIPGVILMAALTVLSSVISEAEEQPGSGIVWPFKLESAADFDDMSRGAILLFTAELSKLPEDEAGMKAAMKLDFADRESARVWREDISRVLLENFLRAAQTARADRKLYLPEITPDGSNFVAAAVLASEHPPKGLEDWHAKAKLLLSGYARNQLRLAAIFPKAGVSSEIRKYAANERIGFELPDRHFVLTFDDGPTAPGGNTDQTIAALKAQQVSGLFLGIGPALQSRLEKTPASELAELYKGMTLGIHGINHLAHTGNYDWQGSVKRCQALADRITGPGSPRLFRPPFGARNPDMADSLAKDGYQIVLWNIDSSDWNIKLETSYVVARTRLLMALWRRGIILFHDCNPHAPKTIPELIPEMKAAGAVFDPGLNG